MNAKHRRWNHLSGLLLTLALLLAVLTFGVSILPRAVAAVHPDPVIAAWERARTAGSYHFASDVVQQTIPSATIANVGRSSHTEKLRLEGQADLRRSALELRLWEDGGSVLQDASGVGVRVENGKTWVRQGAGEWREVPGLTDSMAPQGDFMAYLVAVREVTAHAPETRGGIDFTRYSFRIDGPSWAGYMRDQLEAAMRQKGELPPDVQLDLPSYYRDMRGTGELWVGRDGLPLRQILDLRFPEQHDERVDAHITVDFSQFGLGAGAPAGLLDALQQQTPGPASLLGLLAALTFAIVLVRFHRSRRLYNAVVAVVIASMVAGPLLNGLKISSFMEAQAARAATHEQQRAEADTQREMRTALAQPNFDPHANPLVASQQRQATGDQRQATVLQLPVSSRPSPVSSLPSAPNAQTSDTGVDTDGDGLTDFTEVRIGTSKVISDTDDDGLLDNLEVNGFPMDGQTWYTNPDATDSNNDGQSDLVEWGIDSSTGLPQATPRDTDSDRIPDLFDPDNDNDGVPDRDDTAPFAKGAATFSEANPLQLTVNNLAPGKPAFVEFQIRPQDPKNLWFAYNVLDWPRDNEAQVRDVDGKTYADTAATQGRTADVSDANGDMKLVPMLEIRIPAASANLPSQAELIPFNISVNDFTADGATQVAYVPLTIVTDQLTGERVAFNGQMRYKPTGSWTVPHSVRLAWVVQALNDLPCDPKAADAAAQGCQSDGYIHNYPSMIHSYYDNWTLTGLGVREENGASMAILYEDPAVDPNKQDDAPLWALTTALDQHFLSPHDENHDGVRDLKLSDFPARFDRDSNPSDAQRFGIANILQVVSNDYSTSDEAAISTAMTETVKILDTAFKSVVTTDNSIKPLLLFAEENNLRTVGLDQVAAGEGYATQSGASVSFNLAPTAASALPVTVNASLKWMAYCGADGNNVTWRPCTSDEFTSVIEGRYANAPSLPDDTGPEEVPGRMMLALSYYSTLAGGYQAQVQEGTVIPSSRYRLENESDTATRLRIGFNSVAPLPQIIMQSLIHISVAAKTVDLEAATITSQIKGTIKVLGQSYYDLQKSEAALEEFSNTGEKLPPPTKAEIRAIKVPIHRLLPVHFARFAAAAPVGSALMLLFNVLSQVPDLNIPARATLGAIGAAVTAGVTIYLPAATASSLYKFYLSKDNGPKPSLAKLLTNNYTARTHIRIAFVVGLVVNIALIWGFFAYAAGASGMAAGSPEMNKAGVEALAATVVAIVLAALSVTFIGTIIVGIITVIDLILNLICELGVNSLRLQGSFYGGACFSLSTSATKILAYLLYNYEPMIDTSRSDLMVTGAPDVTLADPSKGFVPSNTITVTLPVTTTVVHKSPDPSAGVIINFYLYLFSKDNLRSSTFKYGLTQSGAASLSVDLDQMKDAWQNVKEDHKYVLTPMYSGVAGTSSTLGGIPLVQGINSPAPFNLTMKFAIPAYECWSIVIIPVCRTRKLENTNTMSFTTLKYDVFPNTLADFVALGSKADGGLGQKWDDRIGSLHDADGDGLSGVLFNGLDPNDTTWDADGDGLSDRFELEQRAAGSAYSPLLRDTDGDGLTDKQEAEIGTNPAGADTDNDGLSDGVEVRHQVVDANGKLTKTWAGGWEVTINSTPARSIWVSSDPFNADGDQDGISDQAEKELAANTNPALRMDNQGVPYHPNVSNTPPLAIFTDSSALFGYVGPNQTLAYTTTVVANVPVEPGVLDVTVPASLNFTPAPLALGFNPLTFSTSQTVTQALNIPVGSTATSALQLVSTARTRLQGTGVSDWTVDPLVQGAPLSGYAAPLNAYSSSLTAARADRQDSYLLGSLISESQLGTTEFTTGDVRSYSLPDGASAILENSVINNGTYFLRGDSPATLANNSNGNTLASWDHVDRCNTLTINYMKVVTAGEDHGTSGIEPFITLSTNELGAGQQLWYWDTESGTADMHSGDQRGPNAFGFPITRTICGGTHLEVDESDGSTSDPTQNEVVANLSADPIHPRDNETLTFSGAGHTIEVNVTVPAQDDFAVGGALLNANGGVQRNLSFPRPAVATDLKLRMRHPVVASNGNGFLVAYEVRAENLAGLGADTWLVTQAFDKDGNPIGNSARVAGGSFVSFSSPQLAMDLAWLGDRYRLVWKWLNGATIFTGAFASDGSALDTGWSTLATNAAVASDLTNDYTPKLAYDPTTGHWIMNYIRTPDAAGVVRLYSSATSLIPTKARVTLGDAARQAFATYHPATHGWLVGWHHSPNVNFFPLKADLSDLVTGLVPPFLPVDTTRISSALACPAPQSAAVTDLRFEELPGTTSFADSSGYGDNATSSGASVPAAGVAGAPNAPLSDYAVQFDGVDDRLTVNTAVQDSFAVALWAKSATGANNNAVLVDQGAGVANGWALGLNNGAPRLYIGTQFLNSTTRVDDGQWHFVVGTRNGSTGKVALYVDGNQVASGTATTNALNAFSDLRIGGDRSGGRAFKGVIDHLQMMPAPFATDAVQALYNRTNQSYCVASGLDTDGASIKWGKIAIRQQDTRGGRVTASSELRVAVDSALPVATVASVTNNEVIGPDQVIGGTATDEGVGVALVQVSINNGPWQLASGANTWSFSLAGYSSAVNIRARAVDLVGNVGNPSAAVNVTIDEAPPTITITPPTGTLKPTKNAAGQWLVNLTGAASDATSGIKPGSTLVLLQQQSDVGMAQTQQAATLNGNNWNVSYLLDANLADPTGAYTVTAQTEDNAGNHATPATAILRLDASGPVAALSSVDATRQVITQTLTIGGVVTDTNSIAGIDKLEIAFTPVEQIAALPPDITSDQAETMLDRTWTPVTLAKRGAGQATSAWSFQIPAGLEDTYQIDLRGTDMLGNRAISANLWRGTIDTRDPRVVMTATASGASYFDAAANQQLYEIRFVCAAVDRNLDEAAFGCPGEGIAEPVRSFESIPTLQILFPDLTIRSGLAISYTAWLPTLTPAATTRACDSYGRCAQASTPAATASQPAMAAASTAAAPGAPQAVIVAPANGSFVAADTAVGVSIAAEASAALKTVTLSLDNTVVQTLSFAQTDAVTRTLRTLSIAIPTEGQHTLVARASDWAGATQSTVYPVAFTLDRQAPSVSIDASALTPDDTWQSGSGILRFNGSASDSVGLAAVQIREGQQPFVDASFGAGAWHTALLVQDPEGRTLTITVRAIDRAGRISEISQSIATNLSAPDAPDTSITSGPANPSAVNNASFAFSGSASAVTFECQLDGALYQPCASPQQYNDLSKGSHIFRVRAIDSRGFADLTPASASWTVSASQPDAMITSGPSDPTTSRGASFSFTGDATAVRFECSLDASAFALCTSPQLYSGLATGSHTFLVRARDNSNKAGAAARSSWTIVNAAPVASSQTVITNVNRAVTFQLSASDSDSLTYQVIGAPVHGALVGLAPNLTYVPDTGFSGTDSFTFRASDGQAQSNLATVTILVDSTPPTVTCSVNPNRVWPPNHKLVTVQASVSVADTLSGPAGFTLISVTSNEPDSGLNRDDVPNDIQGWTPGMADISGELRAERSDSGPGRVYTLTYRGMDRAGNAATCSTTVTVPHN